MEKQEQKFGEKKLSNEETKKIAGKSNMIFMISKTILINQN